ncbi:hypothetical protein FOC1_g10005510 [Fusarium oxysporum f. sp. cubense race 1]|uniref:Uncharacterized protein n=1 Tax=Fusarium oxysporum f. sp. cubense (strain race 1) TaxID=1229664 RepID=N4V3F1_FUSC1|nr:hypothetical protein FOC1_g10005510 [Fusarium oxysporum f. sp. cubense race 1]
MPEREFNFKDEYLFYPIEFPEYPGSESIIMPVKEVAMMILMDIFTDKPDWHKKVFDETIVQKWRDEARQQGEDGLYARILQDKLGQGPRKPRDRIITDAAFDYCVEELRGKARYFAQSGLIPTLDGPGNTIIKSDSFIDENLRRDLNRACYTLWKDQEGNVDWHPRSNDMVQNLIHPSMHNSVYDRSPFIQDEVVGVSNALDFMGKGEPVRGQTPLVRENEFRSQFGIGSGKVLPEYWSDKYQWLPANVEFRQDGSAEFTSYVNNLHPTKFPEIYRTIERLVERVIPAWDHCLREFPRFGDEAFAGRDKSRFEWMHEAFDEDDDLWTPEMNEGLPPLTPNVDDEAMAEVKWVKYRDAILPDPKSFEEIDYTPKQSLQEKFKKDGLQIIVKMVSIELTPEKPGFSAGSWHLEGQMNEKIAATALYYFDSENVTPSRLSFRMQTSSVYGTDLGAQGGFARSCVQSYGDVGTPEGRLLAFPNVFQHRVSSFKL